LESENQAEEDSLTPPQTEPPPADAMAPVKSLKVAYVLLLTTGLVGGHRIYLNHWLSALLYPLILFAALLSLDWSMVYLLAAALVVDAALLPRLTINTNSRILDRHKRDPHHYQREHDESIAPWARVEATGPLDTIKGLFRVLVFITIPVLYACLMVWMGTAELIVFPVVILLATGLVTSLDQITRRHPSLLELPAVEDALEHVQRMKAFYWENEPPVRTPGIRVFTRATTEFRPYWRIVGLMVLAILVDFAFSYSDDYEPYLTLETAFWTIAMQIIMCAYAVLILLSQLSAVSFHYSLSGKRIRLRFLTLVALALTGLFTWAAMAVKNDPGEVSLLSYLRLSDRLENPEFQADLVDYSSMFIRYYEPPVADMDTSFVKAEESTVCDTFEKRNLCKPTLQLRKVLKGIAPNNESEAFQVFDAWHGAGENRTLWRGVRYNLDDDDDERFVVVAAWSGSTLCQYYKPEPEQGTDQCDAILNGFTHLPDDPKPAKQASDTNQELSSDKEKL
jgi:hypothetical protein